MKKILLLTITLTVSLFGLVLLPSIAEAAPSCSFSYSKSSITPSWPTNDNQASLQWTSSADTVELDYSCTNYSYSGGVATYSSGGRSGTTTTLNGGPTTVTWDDSGKPGADETCTFIPKDKDGIAGSPCSDTLRINLPPAPSCSFSYSDPSILNDAGEKAGVWWSSNSSTDKLSYSAINYSCASGTCTYNGSGRSSSSIPLSSGVEWIAWNDLGTAADESTTLTATNTHTGQSSTCSDTLYMFCSKLGDGNVVHDYDDEKYCEPSNLKEGGCSESGIVTIEWDSVEHADGYNVLVQTLEVSGTTTYYNTVVSKELGASSNSYTFSLAPLDAETIFYYGVTAHQAGHADKSHIPQPTPYFLCGPTPLEVELSTSKSIVAPGESFDLTWTTENNPDSCVAYGIQTAWTLIPETTPPGSKNPSGGTQTLLYTDPGSKWFGIECIRGGFNDASDYLKVEVSSIGVNLIASKTEVAIGESFDLTWTTENDPDSCTASGIETDWTVPSDKTSTGGTQSLSYTTAGSKTFDITCSKAGYPDTSSSVTVNVGDSIDVSLIPSSSNVYRDETFNLTWLTNGALPDSCEASGDWSGSKDTACGVSEDFSSSTDTVMNFVITCKKAGYEDASASATVTVSGEDPNTTSDPSVGSWREISP